MRLLDRGPRGPEAGLRVWLFRVATNLIRDRGRTSETRRRILAGVPPREESSNPLKELERSEEVEEVRQALARVSPRDREVLLLRQEGFSYREIAEAVDVASSSIGTLLARALKRFAEEYSAKEQGNGTSG